jgi:hypothetical protein
MSEDERLLDEARRSREETEAVREHRDGESEADAVSPEAEPSHAEPSPGEPWAKTSSGDAGSIVDDD